MAGDWIKMRTNLWNDPRIAQICELVEQGEAAVVGAMYWLWATADEHTEDGFMPGLSCFSIDRKTGVRGFANALVTVGWLSANADGVTLLRFAEHNGASAKARAQTARRVSSHKARKNEGHDAENAGAGVPLTTVDASKEGNNGGEVTPDVRNGNATAVTCALPREDIEKNLNTTPKPPKGGDKPIRKRETHPLQTYLDECKAADVSPISADDPVVDYAESAKIPNEFLDLQWREFKARYREPGAKQYKRWPVVFRKSVRGNWFKLWYFDNTGQCCLTTVGIQARNTYKGAA